MKPHVLFLANRRNGIKFIDYSGIGRSRCCDDGEETVSVFD